MKTILVVDDDNKVRNIIRLIFEHLNYRVVDTQNGKDAALKARDIKPDIVVVDVSLPDRNGYEVSREIKSSRTLKHTSVILLTDSNEEFDKIKTKAAEAGADDLATKPIEPEEVRKKVEFLIFPKKERLKFFINPKRDKNPAFAATIFSLLVVFIFTASILYQTFDVNLFEEVESNARSPEPADITLSRTDSKPTPAYKREKRKLIPEEIEEIIENSRVKPGTIIETPAQLSHLNDNEILREESEAKKAYGVEEIPEGADQAETEAATKLTTAATTPETQSYINLTGEWKLIQTVEHTLYSPYQGMQVGYRVFLKQNGKNIMGKAKKLWEDGEKIPPKARSEILIVGTLDGRILTATFVEEGTLRTTSGSFVWTVSPDGKKLQGSFTSTAAGSSGISVGNKVL